MKITSAKQARRHTQTSAVMIEKSIGKEIITRCDARISAQMSLGETSVVVQIPLFMWSLPAYDVNEMTKYVGKHYQKIGFKVESRPDLELMLDWSDPKSEPDSSETESNSSSDSSESDSEGSGSDESEGSDSESSGSEESEESESDGSKSDSETKDEIKYVDLSYGKKK